MRIERVSPFQFLPKQQWRAVYVIVRGTQMSIHKIKTSHFGTETLVGAGKLIRRYTLQHAEVGLAQDVSEDILMPTSRLSSLIPTVARRRAFQKDSDLFRCDKLFSIRLRLETDQLLLAVCSEEASFNWVSSVCSGIDIAYPIDERSMPRQCTVPRRRRRQQRPVEAVENLDDQRLIREQERILREMYPTLARSMEDNSNALQQVETVDFAQNAADLNLTATNNDQENEDIDLSTLAEDFAGLEASVTRPATSRQTTASTVATGMSSFGGIVNPSNFNAEGKWAPPHLRSAGSQFRYARRCMPVLLFDTPRASNIVMCYGRRLRINYRMDMLEEWELSPPTYDAHNFQSGGKKSLDRTSPANTSSNDSASLAQSGSDMDIQVVQTRSIEGVDSIDALLEKTQTRSLSDAHKINLVVIPGQQQQQRNANQHGIKTDQEQSPVESTFPTLIRF